MKNILLCLLILFFAQILPAQCITVASWNIRDLGKTKDEAEIHLIAQTLRDFDFVALQEVVAKDPAGAQKVAAIAGELNRMGAKWDYRVSDPTTNESAGKRERYAFLWKTSKVSLTRIGLDAELEAEITREPYLAEVRIKKGGGTFRVVNFHSVPHNQHPEKEIALFTSYYERFAPEPVVLMGDWNLNESHAVWEKFRGYGTTAALCEEPTTLKRSCVNGNYTNHHIDNVYYQPEKIRFVGAGAVDFVGGCELLEFRRGISDHLPVWTKLCAD